MENAKFVEIGWPQSAKKIKPSADICIRCEQEKKPDLLP